MVKTTWFTKFTHSEATGGILLFSGAIIALICVNSPLHTLYLEWLNTPIVVNLGPLYFNKNVHYLINDGLMTFFFLLMALEIKRELFSGNVHSVIHARLPIICAIGGMLVPALIFVALNFQSPFNLRGWAIPTATDIAFSLAVISLLGSRVSISLKIFFTSLAIFDDILAILIIAFFYTDTFSALALLASMITTIILIVFNQLGVRSIILYCVVGIFLWWSLFHSGIHATLSGIILAFTIPSNTLKSETQSPLALLENAVQPWVKFLILPLFAIANTGLSLTHFTLTDIFYPLPLGICLGLFIGKQVGIMTSCWFAVKYKLAVFPPDARWLEMYGISILCGVGFTLSIFIGNLAFAEDSYSHLHHVKLGVLTGSTLSALCAYIVLYLAERRKMR